MLDRQKFYDQHAPARPKDLQRSYHRLINDYFSFLVPPGSSVLDLGCGPGDVLAAVRPARGVGVDFSPNMIALAKQANPQFEFHLSDITAFNTEEKFDYILMSDVVNDLADVQAALEQARQCSRENTRLVINCFNTLWRPILAVAEKLNLKAPTLEQNWLSLDDLKNLLHLAGWEIVKADTKILWPLCTPVIGEVFNRWLAPFFKHLCLTIFIVARPRPAGRADRDFTCSVVIPARNESGNIETAVLQTPELGLGTEIIFVEGHSTDKTWEEIQRVAAKYPHRKIKTLKQTTNGKGAAVREAFAVATGDILMILDADLTVPPEDLKKFYEAVRSGTAEFANGVRLVYPMENQAMRFLNMIGNKFFSLAFSWILGSQIKDTLCGTKVLFRSDYELIARNRSFFGDFDPFGDFDLLFGAAKLNLRIVDVPVRYRARTYGETNISRWKHGWLLLRMVVFAAKRLKFFR